MDIALQTHVWTWKWNICNQKNYFWHTLNLNRFSNFFTSNYHLNCQRPSRAHVPTVLYKKLCKNCTLQNFSSFPFPSLLLFMKAGTLVGCSALSSSHGRSGNSISSFSSQVLLWQAVCHPKWWWSSGGMTWFLLQQVPTSFSAFSLRPLLGTQIYVSSNHMKLSQSPLLR